MSRRPNALSVYEGYLINQLDLDQAFRLIDIERTPDGRVAVRWTSSGNARGTVEVRSAATLTPAPDWSLQNGSVAFDNSVSTWTSDSAPDGVYFRIRILDSDA